jgi:hypothetical protein
LQKKRLGPAGLASCVQRQAQARATEEARRVPWQILLEARNLYLDWQEFYCWARSIIESEDGIPDWLATRLEEMFPGFVEEERQYTARRPKDVSPAPVRLGQWIDERIFGFANRGDWLFAITFYAVREPRYQRASASGSESVKKWRKAKPTEYPAFELWRSEAARCDETAQLLPEVRKESACFKLVDSERLIGAVARFIDWEAFAYWAGPALEASASVPREVADELNSRCSGFMEFDAKERVEDKRLPHDWHRLMLWIGEHFFQDSKAEGWYDAILISARIHPRAIRTMEYFEHCDDIWNSGLPVPYPSFETWRCDADRYLDLAP